MFGAKFKTIGIILVIGIIMLGSFSTLDAYRFWCTDIPEAAGRSCMGGSCMGDYWSYEYFGDSCRLYCWNDVELVVRICVLENIWI